MSKLRVFEAFAGYGSQSIALRNIGVPYEVVGISEIDPDALVSYGSVNDMEVDNNVDIESAKIELMNSNVGFDFKTQKSSIPRMKTDKLVKLYTAHKVSNNLGDISKIKVEDIPDHDLFTYSFPCQDISVAGKQQGVVRGETRSGLLYECEKVIEGKRPKYLLLENVKNLVGKKHIEGFNEWLKYLEGLGYVNYWKILNAKDYGVPQNRERVFVVSILGEHKPYEFPKPIKLEKRLKDILEIEIDDKYYLSEKVQKRFKQTKKDDGINNIIGTTAPEDRSIGQRDRVYGNNSIAPSLTSTDYKQPKQIVDYAERIGGCFDDEKGKHQAGSVWNKNGLSPTLDTMQGGYRQPLVTEEINIEKVGHLDCKGWHEIETRVHSTNGLAPTVETRNRAKYFESNYRIRKLTPRECFRLMGLNDEDIDKIQMTKISDTQQYKLAGNSIVVNVLEGIFENLFLK